MNSAASFVQIRVIRGRCSTAADSRRVVRYTRILDGANRGRFRCVVSDESRPDENFLSIHSSLCAGNRLAGEQRLDRMVNLPGGGGLAGALLRSIAPARAVFHCRKLCRFAIVSAKSAACSPRRIDHRVVADTGQACRICLRTAATGTLETRSLDCGRRTQPRGVEPVRHLAGGSVRHRAGR